MEPLPLPPDVLYISYFDVPDRYISLACNLCDLTDPQLTELITRVSKKHAIGISEDWNTDKKKCDKIFLIRDSDYKNLDDVDKIELERMKKYYERAKDNFDFDARFIAPLKCCLEVAEDVRKSKSSDSKSQAEPKKQKRRTHEEMEQILTEAIKDRLSNPTITKAAIEKKWELGAGTLSKPKAKELEQKIKEVILKATMRDRKVSKEVGDELLHSLKNKN